MKTNLLDLNNDVLNIIGDFVKKIMQNMYVNTVYTNQIFMIIRIIA